MGTTTATRTFNVGDLVIVDPAANWPYSTRGIVYRITQVPTGARGVNYLAKPKDNPAAPGIRGRSDSLLPWSEGETTTPVHLIEYKPLPVMGAVVRVSGFDKINPNDLYVVMGPAKRPNCVRLVLLGGNDDRYFTAIPVDRLTIVPRENILAV